MNSADPSQTCCPACGTPAKLAGEDALCPGCLLSAALNRGYMGSEDAAPAMEECGGYALEKIIGRGSNGVVFLARRPGSIIPYALKMLASAQLAGPDEILYEFSVEDPVAYTQPWKGELTFRRSPDRIYEYACHEGNHSVPNILQGAREMERQGLKPAVTRPRARIDRE